MKYLILTAAFFVFTAMSCEKDEDRTDCVEDIKEDCLCTMEYDPVCGCNGKTYSNACHAGCAGIPEYTEGECDGK